MARMKNQTSVSRDDFIGAVIAASCDGESFEDISARLGLELASVKQRYASYVKKGIKLPTIVTGPRGAKKIDVAALNALVASKMAVALAAREVADSELSA